MYIHIYIYIYTYIYIYMEMKFKLQSLSSFRFILGWVNRFRTATALAPGNKHPVTTRQEVWWTSFSDPVGEHIKKILILPVIELI